MNAPLPLHEPLSNLLAPQATDRLPIKLPLGFPQLFAKRLEEIAGRVDVSDKVFQQLYFDLVLCPQLHATMRRMQPNCVGASGLPTGEAIFVDPQFDWSNHIDSRLGFRWRECLLRHNEGRWLSEEVALLSGFRLLAAHLH
ncbi:MAG: hypothetical protein JO218_09040 [Burkholderiales bacterium]|nr:hypothetical protein [Burkholderiales bacterium]